MKSPHKNWKQLVADGSLDQVVLKPGSHVSDSALRVHRHHYPNTVVPNIFLPNATLGAPIRRDTLFWKTYNGKKEVAALFLQGRISKAAQDEAREGFRAMKWAEPKRAETKTAIERQRGGVAPGELLFGHMDRGSIEKTMTTREQGPAFAKLGRILTEMNDIFSRTERRSLVALEVAYVGAFDPRSVDLHDERLASAFSISSKRHTAT